MKSERARSGERPKFINFMEAFHRLSIELAQTYSLSEGNYSQSASISRFEEGTSINQAKEFLNHVE